MRALVKSALRNHAKRRCVVALDRTDRARNLDLCVRTMLLALGRFVLFLSLLFFPLSLSSARARARETTHFRRGRRLIKSFTGTTQAKLTQSRAAALIY